MMTLLPRKRYLSQKEFEGEETNRKKKQNKKTKTNPKQKTGRKIKKPTAQWSCDNRAIVVVRQWFDYCAVTLRINPTETEFD